YLIARDAGRLRLTLLGASVLGGLASLAGILQAILGPSFLAPWAATPGLIHLVFVTGYSDDTTVFRPSGTFVDPGRFDEMALTTLAVGIATAFLLRGRWRWLALGCALTAAAAVWISAGRTGLVEGLTILVAAGVVLLPVMGRNGLKLAALVGALV